MDRESGQATVEWVALLLLAALVLAAAAAHSFAKDDRELGRLVAKKIASGPRALAPRSPGASAPAPRTPASPAPPPPPRPASPARAANAFRRLRGLGQVAGHTWIVCLGYRRWRYELEHPLAPTEPLPLRDALEIANSCLNPYGFLFGD